MLVLINVFFIDVPLGNYSFTLNDAEQFTTSITKSTLCLKKNIPDVFSYNSRKH